MSNVQNVGKTTWKENKLPKYLPFTSTILDSFKKLVLYFKKNYSKSMITVMATFSGSRNYFTVPSVLTVKCPSNTYWLSITVLTLKPLQRSLDPLTTWSGLCVYNAPFHKYSSVNDWFYIDIFFLECSQRLTMGFEFEFISRLHHTIYSIL